MKILVCPDKFKGSLTAEEVCLGIKKGIDSLARGHSVEMHPLADGGDGSLELLSKYKNLDTHYLSVQDPLGRTIHSSYKSFGSAAYIEYASASGYVLLKENERTPMLSSGYGTGQQIEHAIRSGFREVVLFMGGSATNDAGIGILSALGFRFLDASGVPIKPIGANLIKISKIINPKNASLKETQFTLLCDVDNPLHGPNGAACTYAAQKGASPEEIEFLDKGLKHFASIVQEDTGLDIQNIKGAGACGGVPGGLSAFLNVTLKPGAEHFIEMTGLEDRISEADLLITGEGCLDASSLSGKLPYVLFQLAQKHNKEIVFFVGHCGLEDFSQIARSRISAISDIEADQTKAMSNASELLSKITASYFLDQE